MLPKSRIFHYIKNTAILKSVIYSIFHIEDKINNLDYVENNLIRLPCHPKINKKYQDFIIKTKKDFFEK